MPKQSKPVLTRKTTALLAILCAVVVVATAVLFVGTNVITSYEMPMTLEVVGGNHPAGFNLTTTVVAFGKLSPGGTCTRYFNLSNFGDTPVKAVLKTSGELASWVVLTPPTAVLPPHSNNTIVTAAAVVPANAKPGDYTGTLHVYMMKP
jgi:hypothetical protein